MPRLAANISLLFPEMPFMERFAAAAAAGFRAVEYQFPYALGSAAEIAAHARDAGVQVVLHNLPAGDADRGERGLACLPGREAAFRDGVERALEYARAAGCPRLNALAGLAPADAAPELVFETLVENLRYAAARLAEAGMTLLAEPINTRSIPGFYLSTTRQWVEVADAVDASNFALQYDIFHMQIMEGGPTSATGCPRIASCRWRSCCPRPRRRCAVLQDLPRARRAGGAARRRHRPVGRRAAARGDGVLLSLAKFNRILRVDPVARTARVQPGVRNLAISEAAAPHGLYYAPDPSSQIACTIGGNVAENSGGVHCLKYGLTVHNVLRVRGVTIDGEPRRARRPALDAPGWTCSRCDRLRGHAGGGHRGHGEAAAQAAARARGHGLVRRRREGGRRGRRDHRRRHHPGRASR
jgi:hydroxypyruvate isomerase